MSLILVTGGNGRFASELKKVKSYYKFIFLNKNQLNILKPSSISTSVKKYRPNMILHIAGLSRPMSIHDNELVKSINSNIVGTCNIVKECINKNIKLIYFSTSYIYPGKKGNYKETDGVLPWNNYGWSKLGGECAVQMYKNSLILRACMTEEPFIHKEAFTNVKSNFIYHKDFIKLFLKIIDKKGIYNIGGKSQTIYSFAKKYKPNILKKKSLGDFPLKQDMNLLKLRKAINYTK